MIYYENQWLGGKPNIPVVFSFAVTGGQCLQRHYGWRQGCGLQWNKLMFKRQTLLIKGFQFFDLIFLMILDLPVCPNGFYTCFTHPRPHISCCLIATCNQFPFWMLQLLPPPDRKHAQSCSEYGGGQCWDPYKTASGLDRRATGKIWKRFSRCICNHLSHAATDFGKFRWPFGAALFFWYLRPPAIWSTSGMHIHVDGTRVAISCRDAHVGQHGLSKCTSDLW